MAPPRTLYLQDHFEKLRYLAHVTRSGSISAAARDLGLTQSAISHSIRTLEIALDQDLLIRKSRGVEPTEAPRQLVAFVLATLDRLEELELHLTNPSNDLSGKLGIGTHETLAVHILPILLKGFYRRFPRVNVDLTSGRVDGLIEAVVDEKLHVAVTVEPFKRDELSSVPLYEGRVRFFGPLEPLDQFAAIGKASVSKQEAESVPLLMDVDAHVRQGLPMPRAIGNMGLSLRNLVHLNSFEAAMRLAAQGVGIAAVPDRNAAEMVGQGKLRQLDIEGLQSEGLDNYTICATFLRRKAERPLLQHFVDIILNE